MGIRAIYFAEPDKFRGNIFLPGVVNMTKQFGGVDFLDEEESKIYSYNSLKFAYSTDYDFPWEDFMKIREKRNLHYAVDGYRRRQFFHAPHQKSTFVLNSEELATIFHPVGTILQTPTVERVASRKAEAPSNLPR